MGFIERIYNAIVFSNQIFDLPGNLIYFTKQNMPTSILWLKNHMGLGLADGYWAD